MRPRLALAAIVLFAAPLPLAPAAPLRPVRVDLSARGTPPKDQGARGTCTAFAACAALEAAYRAAGHGELDLSEEFLATLSKTMWIHPQWRVTERRGVDVPENELAAASGSTGTFLVELLASGFGVPTEADHPYRPAGYAGLLDGHEALGDPWWKVVWNVDLWNHGSIRPRSATTAPRYHRVADYRWLFLGRRETDPTYAERFEEALASGHEVVVDISVRAGERARIWRYDPAHPPETAHAMLVVGYDRSSPDPREHRFLVKNSWGPTANPGGLTWIAYDFLRYAMGALYVERVAPPAPWPEVRFVGRWHLSLDGRPAVLSLNRVPGVLRKALDQARAIHPDEPALVDRRAGNLHPEGAVRPLLRVNGAFSGSTASLRFDPATPLLRYDALTGRALDLRLLDGDPTIAAGTFETETGARRPCYARLGGPLGTPGAPRERSAAELSGSWRVRLDGVEGSLGFEGAAGGGVVVRLPSLGLHRAIRGATDPADSRVLVLRDELPVGGAFELRLALLTSEDGVLVGEVRVTAPDGAVRVLGACATRAP